MKILKPILATVAILLPLQLNAAVTGNFKVELGPFHLGNVSIASSCSNSICKYSTDIDGSFMSAEARIIEKGAYYEGDDGLIPISGHYIEVVSSKDKKEYSYDFVNGIVRQKSDLRKMDLSLSPLLFTPLLNQIAIDLKKDKLKEQYTLISKGSIRKVSISSHTSEPIDSGVRHVISIKKKGNPIEFTFFINGDEITLSELSYKGFDMVRA